MGRMKRQYERRIAATPVTLDEEYAEMFRDQRWIETPLLPPKTESSNGKRPNLAKKAAKPEPEKARP